MRIYTSWGVFTLIGAIPFIVHKFNLIPNDLYLGSVYIYILLLLTLSAVMTIFLARSSKDERRGLFLSLLGFLSLNIFAVTTVGQAVWTRGYFLLTLDHLKYFIPVSLVANFPVISFLIWKTVREARYLDVKHFVLPVLATTIMIILLVTSFRGIAEFSDYLLVGNLICDIIVLSLLLIFLSEYFKTETLTYYGFLSGYFSVKYVVDYLIFLKILEVSGFDLTIFLYLAASTLMFSGIRHIYSKEVTFLSYYELDSERKKYAELYEKVRELQEILRLTNRMLRHDILNKLQIISGYIETFMMTKNESLLEKALKAVKESSDYIEKIRELEKIVITEGEGLKPINVRRVVEDVAKSYSVPININGFCFVMADEALHSVMDNIISNAIKHGRTEKIDVWLSEFEDEAEIKIVDYGLGIEPEIRSEVFKEGFKFGEDAGTGLGLYIVKKVVDRYGGKVWIEDTKPHGATFVIRLKAARKSLISDDERAPLTRDEGFEF
ncbi:MULTISPECIES: sensor histidine kinase [unclassified Archaeoglobus]|jgi:signal transduction histidine kinase|uniref:sensor histidine kinase n=1 Tax=unclassified Archaeoglobus TaxID=2643606 RepID=UPI0025BE9EA5|nr:MULTISPECIES: HAMP domain-containing sensor histidine kinase [unclassified Archaeoglobus]